MEVKVTNKRTIAGCFVNQINSLMRNHEGYVAKLALERIIITMTRVCSAKFNDVDGRAIRSNVDQPIRFTFDDDSEVIISNPYQYVNPVSALEVTSPT